MKFKHLSDDELLTELDKERQKFTKSDEAVMSAMIAELIARGVYPAETPVGNPNTVKAMVGGWGARWHEWDGIQDCPHCKADLRDHRTGAPFSRKVGLYGNDRTYAYRCPECKGEWSREEDDATRKAKPTVSGFRTS